MSKNKERRERFQKIGAAIDAIYRETAWRHRQQKHDFEMRASALDSKDLSSRSAGGPIMNTLQYEASTHGIRGMSQLIDRLTALQQVELKLLGLKKSEGRENAD